MIFPIKLMKEIVILSVCKKPREKHLMLPILRNSIEGKLINLPMSHLLAVLVELLPYGMDQCIMVLSSVKILLPYGMDQL
jgi:hypothetical protein